MKKYLPVIMAIFMAVSFLHSAPELTFPKIGDKFVVGSDTIITWTGTVPGDTVFLEYSFDKGNTWIPAKEDYADGEYLFANIADNDSVYVRLIRRSKITIKEDEPYIEWSKTYGSGAFDTFGYIYEIPEGKYIAIGRTEDGNS